jgi:hypothetical protein
MFSIEFHTNTRNPTNERTTKIIEMKKKSRKHDHNKIKQARFCSHHYAKLCIRGIDMYKEKNLQHHGFAARLRERPPKKDAKRSEE